MCYMEVLPSMESHFCYTLDFAKRTTSRGVKPLLVSTHIITCDAKLDLVGENVFRNPRTGYSGSEYPSPELELLIVDLETSIKNTPVSHAQDRNFSRKTMCL